MNNPTRNTFPALRCFLGDWVYYITYMRFVDIMQWIKPTSEVHQNKALRDMMLGAGFFDRGLGVFG